MSRDWRSHWEEFPAELPEHDFLRQVGKTVGGQPITAEQVDRIVSDIIERLVIGPDDVLLDLCCGNGLLTARLADRAASVVGVDWSGTLIDLARRHHGGPNIRYVQRSVLDLDADDLGGLRPTRVLMYEALQHFRRGDLPRLLERIATLSDRPRVLLGSVPDRDRRWRFYDTPRRRLGWLRARLGGREAIGTWWRAGWIRQAGERTGLVCTILGQHPALHTAHYRFDALLLPREGS